MVFPENYFKKNDKANKTLVKELYKYGRRNLANVHVVIQSPYITKIKRDVAMTFTSFIANEKAMIHLFRQKFFFELGEKPS